MTAKELPRVRFVARHYSDLQGLHSVAIFVAILLWIATDPIGPGVLGYLGVVLHIASLFALVLIAGACLRRYYDRTFGRVPAKVELRWDRLLACLAGVVLAGAAPGDLDITAIYLGSALMYLWVALRDGPFRWYYVIGAFGCLVATVLTWDAAAGEIQRRALLLWQASAAAVGLLDHCLLASVLRRRSADFEPSREVTR